MSYDILMLRTCWNRKCLKKRTRLCGDFNARTYVPLTRINVLWYSMTFFLSLPTKSVSVVLFQSIIRLLGYRITGPTARRVDEVLMMKKTCWPRLYNILTFTNGYFFQLEEGPFCLDLIKRLTYTGTMWFPSWMSMVHCGRNSLF